MGGDKEIGAAEAVSVLSWWIDAGVDVATQDAPRNWLKAEQGGAPAAPVREPEPAALRETLSLFRAWLAESPPPSRAATGGRVLPSGPEGAPVMLMADLPTQEDAAAGQPIAGEAWQLVQRMMRAIGIDPGEAYCASLSCAHVPGGRLSREELEQCGAIGLRHVALARPKRLLLFGETPCRALLGKGLADARGHIHSVDGVRTVATFEPRFLMRRPSYKALAWQDLLLLMENEG